MFFSGNLFFFDFSLQGFHRVQKYPLPLSKKPNNFDKPKSETYSEPCQRSEMKRFPKKILRNARSYMYDWVLSTPLKAYLQTAPFQ